MKISDLPRRKVRYWLFRFRNEVIEGVSSNGAPPGLKKHFENLPQFTGWEDFGVRWDLPHLEDCSHGGWYKVGESCSCANKKVPLICSPIRRSIWGEWRRTIKNEAPVLPVKVINGSES